MLTKRECWQDELVDVQCWQDRLEILLSFGTVGGDVIPYRKF